MQQWGHTAAGLLPDSGTAVLTVSCSQLLQAQPQREREWFAGGSTQCNGYTLLCRCCPATVCVCGCFETTLDIWQAEESG